MTCQSLSFLPFTFFCFLATQTRNTTITTIPFRMLMCTWKKHQKIQWKWYLANLQKLADICHRQFCCCCYSTEHWKPLYLNPPKNMDNKLKLLKHSTCTSTQKKLPTRTSSTYATTVPSISNNLSLALWKQEKYSKSYFRLSVVKPQTAQAHDMKLMQTWLFPSCLAFVWKRNHFVSKGIKFNVLRITFTWLVAM